MFGKRKRDEDPEEFDGFEEYGEYADDDGYMPDEYADGNGPDDYTEDYGTDGYAEDDFGEMPPEDAPPYSDMNDGWDREMPEDADGEEKIDMWSALSFEDKRQTADILIKVICAADRKLTIQWRI